jgi:hypothetical protein
LGYTKNSKAFDALSKLLAQPSWKGRIQSAGLNGLAALEDKRALDLGFKYANDKTVSSNVRNTTLTIVASTGKGDARAFPLIFEAFKKSLDSNDFNGLFISVQAFIKLADPRGQQAFDLMKDKFKTQGNVLGFVMFFEAQFKAAIGK